MRHIGWNVHDITRSKALGLAARNRGTAHFVRFDSFGFKHGSTYYERGFASLNNQDIDLRFMKLSAAVAFAVGNSHQVVFIGAKGLPGKLLVINLAGKISL